MALTARKVLSWFFNLKRKLSSIPSMTGSQLERAKNNYNLSMGSRLKVLEDLQIALADVGMLTKDLTKDELAVCELRYGTRAKTVERYKRVVREDEVRRISFDEGGDELLTADGETYVGPAYGSDGNVLAGYVEVVGWKGRCLTYNEIATTLGLPFRVVRYTDRSACEKVRLAIRKRQKEELVQAKQIEVLSNRRPSSEYRVPVRTLEQQVEQLAF